MRPRQGRVRGPVLAEPHRCGLASRPWMPPLVRVEPSSTALPPGLGRGRWPRRPHRVGRATTTEVSAVCRPHRNVPAPGRRARRQRWRRSVSATPNARSSSPRCSRCPHRRPTTSASRMHRAPAPRTGGSCATDAPRRNGSSPQGASRPISGERAPWRSSPLRCEPCRGPSPRMLPRHRLPLRSPRRPRSPDRRNPRHPPPAPSSPRVIVMSTPVADPRPRDAMPPVPRARRAVRSGIRVTGRSGAPPPCNVADVVSYVLYRHLSHAIVEPGACVVRPT